MFGGVYLFKGGKKVESFLNIIGVDEVIVNILLVGILSLVFGLFFIVKKFLKVVYVLLIKLYLFKVIICFIMVLLRLFNYIKLVSFC